MGAERLIKQRGITMNTIQKIGLSMLAACGLSTAVHAMESPDVSACVGKSQVLQSITDHSVAEDKKDASEESITAIKDDCVNMDCADSGDEENKRKLDEAVNLHKVNVQELRDKERAIVENILMFKQCILSYCASFVYSPKYSSEIDGVRLCVETLDIVKMATEMAAADDD